MVKKVTFFRTLMVLAKELGKARRKGDPEAIRKAEEKHEAYRQLCLDSDEMRI